MSQACSWKTVNDYTCVGIHIYLFFSQLKLSEDAAGVQEGNEPWFCESL